MRTIPGYYLGKIDALMMMKRLNGDKGQGTRNKEERGTGSA
ncbi:MAG: hypothetical protein ACRD3E_01900 [Terriglobales bacterium]